MKKKSKNPILTISLLISNRPDTIPRCLDSLLPIMKAIPSELILIDTSKNEEIHELLLTYTDRVYEFEWCKDFAKARNEGIKRARGEWFLYLDDDEWLADAEEILKFFRTGEYKNFGHVNIQVRNFFNKEYTLYSDAWVTRLFHLDKETCFVGKVHEYIYHLHGQHTFLPILLYHSGYIFDTEEKKKQHFERNANLLLELVEEEPHVLRWQGQMVQEYHTIEDWDAIVEFCQKHLKNVNKIENFMDQNHLCTLYAGLIEGLEKLERYEEVFEVCEQARKDERSTELLKALLHFREAETYLSMENWIAAKEAVERYFKDYEYYKKHKDSMREQMGSLLVHRVFEKPFIDTAYNILIYSELKRGNIESLNLCLKDGKTDVSFSVMFINYLVELIVTMEYQEIFARFIKAAVQNQETCTMLCAAAQRWEEKDEEAFRKIAYVCAETDSKFWYICYCRLIVADERNDKAAVEKLLEQMLETLTNVFYLPDKAYDIVDKYNIKVARMWDKIAGKKWKTEMLRFVSSCKQEYIDRVEALLKDVYPADDWRVKSLEYAWVEKQIKIGPQAAILDYYELLKLYAQIKISAYNSNNRAAETTDIPVDVQAAIKIQKYIDLEMQDKMSALRELKGVAEVYPILAEGLGSFFHRYTELEKQRVQKQKAEMEQLRIQVITQVRSMIQLGQNAAALQIVQQLKQMFPGDLEVEQLALEIRLKTLE